MSHHVTGAQATRHAHTTITLTKSLSVRIYVRNARPGLFHIHVDNW